jgi:thymidine kinase
MAKFYFYYSAMNAGKSTVLLQSSHNYRERGMATVLFTPIIDTRFEPGVIHCGIIKIKFCHRLSSA